ncbi:MAG: DUF3426 domain-containing protein [Pseudomonas sp.]|uniref:DUF3426 domain-containing protein n=1 Tax=Pseudomonas sp. TaxID=306 RepID=UPI003D0B39CD
MSESFVTQCPNCRTSFRVSHAQLGAARGAVRCGACLHVFNAAQQLLEQGQMTAAPSPAPVAAKAEPIKPSITQVATEPARITPAKPVQATPPGKNPSDTLWIHDDLDLDSLDLDEELAKLEEQELQLSRQFMELEKSPKYTESFLPLNDNEPEAHDEGWAEALLREEPPKPATPPPVAVLPTSLPKVSISEPAPPPALAPRDEPSISLDQVDNEPDETHIELTLPAGTPLTASRDTADDRESSDEIDEPAASEPVTRAPVGKAQRSEPGLRDEHLFELDEEPLQLDWEPQRSPWGRWLGWGFLNLLGAAALAGQYIHYHFDELARQDQYRPWFEQGCPAIGCNLPSKVDISQVKSSNLVVRSHPEFSGALVVDAILYNRAPFSQPFPLLEMRFADINGQLLASRRFKPSEYLAGELAGQAEMPPQTPIHVSLDILDPGTQAVNYSLSFHSPE